MRLTLWTFCFILAMLFFGSRPAAAAPSLTVTNDNLALVREVREIPLKAGTSRIVLDRLPPQLVPSSLLVLPSATAPAFTVLEQGRETVRLTPGRLLQASVGAPILLRRPDGKTVPAQLVAAAEGIVVKTEEGYEAGVNFERLIFPELPTGLTATPGISLLITAAAEGKGSAELTYLTGGLSWSADYALVIDKPAENGLTATLRGFATIANRSGAGFADATLQLLAGQINRVSDAMPQPKMMMARAPLAEAAMMLPDQEASGANWLYSLPRPVTLADDATVQVALFAPRSLSAETIYEVRGRDDHGDAYGSDRETLPVRVRLEFANSGDDALPLPAGIVRVFRHDSAGRLQLDGEDRIGHTPTGAPVALDLGVANDLTVERVQSDFIRVAGPQKDEEKRLSSYRITLRNGGSVPLAVRVIELIGGDWTILGESQPHEKISAGEALWRVLVPANGSALLEYQVETRY